MSPLPASTTTFAPSSTTSDVEDLRVQTNALDELDAFSSEQPAGPEEPAHDFADFLINLFSPPQPVPPPLSRPESTEAAAEPTIRWYGRMPSPAAAGREPAVAPATPPAPAVAAIPGEAAPLASAQIAAPAGAPVPVPVPASGNNEKKTLQPVVSERPKEDATVDGIEDAKSVVRMPSAATPRPTPTAVTPAVPAAPGGLVVDADASGKPRDRRAPVAPVTSTFATPRASLGATPTPAPASAPAAEASSDSTASASRSSGASRHSGASIPTAERVAPTHPTATASTHALLPDAPAPAAPVAPTAGPANTAAAELIERVAHAADQLAARPTETVRLRIELQDTGTVTVQVSIRDGQVHTAFRSDSADVRQALAAAWGDFVSGRDAGRHDWAPPIIAPAHSTVAAAESSDGTFSQSSFDRGADPRRQEPPAAPFTSPQRGAAPGATSGLATPVVREAATVATPHQLRALA